MRRLFVICALVAGCSAGLATAAPSSPVRSKLRSFLCKHAIDPASRAVGVTSIMRPLPHTAKMAIRFELLRKPSHSAPATSLVGPGLQSWISPTNPTLGQRPGDVWIVHHPVVDLAAPGYYRIKVTFRWSDAKGAVIGTMVRVSQSCYQPELRPDLAVQWLHVKKGPSGTDTYRMSVRNDGQTAAEQFSLQLEIAGNVVGSRTVRMLAPGKQVIAGFNAAACPAGQELSASADPWGQVDDFNRANNTLLSGCPAT